MSEFYIGFIWLTVTYVTQSNAKDNLLLRFIFEAYCVFSKVRAEYLNNKQNFSGALILRFLTKYQPASHFI